MIVEKREKERNVSERQRKTERDERPCDERERERGIDKVNKILVFYFYFYFLFFRFELQ